jgi:hypothetical protein
MKTMFKKRWYLFVPLIAVAFVAFGFFTMHLWNWLMPLLFHLPEVTFWQTIGLMILSRLILGGFGGHHGRAHGHCRQRMHEKWENMTPEEREKFRENIHMYRGHWGHRCGNEVNPKES